MRYVLNQTLRPVLLLENCLCLRFESQYESSVSFEMSIPMVSFICLFLTLSCHAGPVPMYPPLGRLLRNRLPVSGSGQ